MTRDECKAAVLENLGQTLGVSAGLSVEAEWAPTVIDELLDLHYPESEGHEFTDSDVAALKEGLRIRWNGGRVR